MTDKQTEFVLELQSIYNTIVLNEIVPDGMSLSESMVKKYYDHKKDLKLYKEYIDSLSDKKKAKQFEAAYALYVNYRKADLLAAKNLLGKKADNMNNFEVFGKFVSDNLDDSELANKIKARLDLGEFLPKQRTNQNGVIPYQLHQVELTQILEKQGKYYPFLITPNPVESHRNNAPYEISELVSFRVPYYVGPLIDPTNANSEQDKANGSFAWMVRQKQGQITPWNFEEMVDTTESANKFIKRMTTKDTYLLGEDVLPASSLIYQKFVILNELNNIKVNDVKLTTEEKHQIFDELFKDRKSVTLKSLIDFLTNHGCIAPEVTGLSDGTKFNSSYSTYIDYRKIFGDEIDNKDKQADFEKMIEWSTVFEDRKIFKRKLEEITWLTPDQIKQVSSKRYSGWGRLSKKLLTQITDENGVNILQRLWNESENLMQILSDPVIKEKIVEANSSFTKATDMEDILAEAYTSPQNKKAIRQVMRVVDDIIATAHGKKPSQIAIEFAREDQDNPQMTKSRKAQLDQTYAKISDEFLDDAVKNELKNMKDNKPLAKDKVFLYFKQMGRDAYTGEKLSLDNLQDYDIDHIYPQSFIKDDSFDNRVLVQRAVNNGKSDNVPVLLFGNKMAADLGMTIRQMWKKWLELGLISKRKFNNLITDPEKISSYMASGFVNRQLVETSQVIKLVANILQAKLPDTEIIEVKASYNSILRKEFNLYKSREVNDYHPAIDAYLTTIVGNYLYQVYPKLRPYFVYGQFKKFGKAENQEDDPVKKIKKFNFIYQLIWSKDDAICISHTDQQVFSKDDIIDKLTTAYKFKYMNVSQEVYTNSNNMFKQTVFPIIERDTAKSRSLIPKKLDRPTDIYGGYSNNNDAYLALVKVDKKKGSEYRVVGIPMRAAAMLKASKNYDEDLSKVIEPMVMFDKNGKAKRGIEGFRVLVGKMPFKQAVLDGDKKFMITGTNDMPNLKQLVLSHQNMKYILDYIDDINCRKHKFGDEVQDGDKCLIEVFDEIIKVVDKHFELFDYRSFREKLRNSREKFIKLTISQKSEAVLAILNGLHANSMRTTIKELKISDLGRIQSSVLSPEAQLIYQSPTGLFERRVKVKDL